MKRLLLPLLIHSAFVSPQSSFATELPTAPMLRIEAGTHTDTIWSVATDASGQIALTVSSDKTARLWELPTGRLLRVLRPPVGPADEGVLYDGSLSPDGSIAAVGGFTRDRSDGIEHVYLFDTRSGRLQQKLDVPDGVTVDVDFSAQGHFLAAAGADWGLRVWDVDSGLEAGRDPDTGKWDVNSVHWHGENRLVAACEDGSLRLYEVTNKKLSRIAKTVVRQGSVPANARFSPDGQQIVVGFGGSAAVAVVSGKDLSLLFTPDTTGLTSERLTKVTWNDDGSVLAASGEMVRGHDRCIRLWPQAGRGSPQDFLAAKDSITDLHPGPGGSILFAAFDPAWGQVGEVRPATASAGAKTLSPSPRADPRDLGSGFRVSADGTTLTFAYEQPGKGPALFSIASRELIHEGGELTRRLASYADSLKPPRIEGLPITDWRHHARPRLAEKLLAIKDNETSRGLAISSDAEFFLLGTQWSLRCFTAQGQERWNFFQPSITWAVNLADKDQLAVAAGSDGVIRWHRADTGKELLAFFPHSDRKRWVLWTPEGYYDCSPGAEDLIGWHVNRGRDHEADFFPAAKFRDQFYRPDIIQLVLPNRDSAAAVAQAGEASGVRVKSTVSISHILLQMAPPVVEMTVGGPTRTLELPADAAETTLTYRVRGGSTPVSQMRVLVDSRPVEARAPIPGDEKEEVRVTVPLPDRDCVVALLAGNNHAFSEPALVNIRRKAAAAPTTPALPKKGVLYLLAVGVSHLKNQAALTDLAKLEYADDDATAFHRVLATQTKLYSKVESRVLTDAKATAGDILDALDWLKEITTPEDTTLILLAGHGESDAQGRYTFCAHDYDRARRLRTGVGFEDIKLALGATKGEVVLFLDACSAGSSLGAGSKVDVSGLVNNLSDSDSNIVVFASSDGRTPSLESDDLKQGLFTHCVKEGLTGKADLLRNGRITLSALQTYVDDAMRKLSDDQQIPVINIPKMVPNLTLGLTP
ncbi:MAG TPA: WD40 repeat domain-containing protein [Prosthecobacter sp.]